MAVHGIVDYDPDFSTNLFCHIPGLPDDFAPTLGVWMTLPTEGLNNEPEISVMLRSLALESGTNPEYWCSVQGHIGESFLIKLDLQAWTATIDVKKRIRFGGPFDGERRNRRYALE